MNYAKINMEYLRLSNSKKNKCNQITATKWAKGNNVGLRKACVTHIGQFGTVVAT